MKIFAVIAEFNPFHNGHKYLLDSIREKYQDAAFIAVMSGSFMQRGDAAVFDKWQRAHLAVLGGVDLVLELPTVFAVRSAEGFAHGAISLLQNLGCVDMLCFGSENSNLDTLQEAAHILNHQLNHNILREKIKTGIPYAAAVEEILAEHMPQSGFSLKAPNTILAIEYLRAIERAQANFSAISINRKKALHNNSTFTGLFSSASSIRKLLRAGQRNTALQKIASAIPANCYFYMQSICKSSNDIAFTENLTRSLLLKLRSLSIDRLRSFNGINNGLEYKILQAAGQADNLAALLNTIKSRHYHYSRLQRSLLHILLDLNKPVLDNFDHQGPSYIRVLAFNRNGRKILKKLKTTSSLPVILKTTNFTTQKQFWRKTGDALQQMLFYDILATDLHALSYNKIRPAGRDFCTSPFYWDDSLI
ncbi:nucleotidyltransferase [Pectinatus cerevisiiphilus]|uniref:tRNA(Met) cytidine acetate ligase n=1 Tax=Pectinatus cerevisiiphilus TaxID=86956 RepID=A0A4R3K9G0_9FIRM|nr:nucleotidyltransferase [Pectinatus cerevisiiphilus]TCS79664.1 putative nucleotidyltransferase [Pectinatus cerevisiiphilus]